jgi:hypothetical protein
MTTSKRHTGSPLTYTRDQLREECRCCHHEPHLRSARQGDDRMISKTAFTGVNAQIEAEGG